MSMKIRTVFRESSNSCLEIWATEWNESRQQLPLQSWQAEVCWCVGSCFTDSQCKTRNVPSRVMLEVFDHQLNHDWSENAICILSRLHPMTKLEKESEFVQSRPQCLHIGSKWSLIWSGEKLRFWAANKKMSVLFPSPLLPLSLPACVLVCFCVLCVSQISTSCGLLQAAIHLVFVQTHWPHIYQIAIANQPPSPRDPPETIFQCWNYKYIQPC